MSQIAETKNSSPTHESRMNLRNLSGRLKPVIQKLVGQLPLCPWRPILQRLDFRTLGAYPPPMLIEVLETDGKFKKLLFDQKYTVWFPEPAIINEELWSEYLCVFWRHRTNGHYYLKAQTPIRPGDICLDCGACEGFFGIQALESGAGKVICLEPSDQMVECLQRTYKREIESGKVIIVKAAVGASEGVTHFHFDSQQPFSGKAQSDSTAKPVRVVTIAGLCQELKLTRIDFIKMDIEGAETQALEGALPVLNKFSPRLAITTYHRAFDYAALRILLIASGYKVIRPAGLADRGEGIYRPVMIHGWN
jgi:FkbM family methyltransferase